MHGETTEIEINVVHDEPTAQVIIIILSSSCHPVIL